MFAGWLAGILKLATGIEGVQRVEKGGRTKFWAREKSVLELLERRACGGMKGEGVARKVLGFMRPRGMAPSDGCTATLWGGVGEGEGKGVAGFVRERRACSNC